MTHHHYAGPQALGFVRSIPTQFRAVCTCGWRGRLCVTRHQAASDHRLHAEAHREAS